MGPNKKHVKVNGYVSKVAAPLYLHPLVMTNLCVCKNTWISCY